MNVSSARFKHDIHNIGERSEELMHLRPVSYKYKPQFDAEQTPQYGLVAEEVAQVDKSLVVFDPDGKPKTVRYHFVNAMLLNEVQRQRHTIDALNSRLEKLEKALAAQKR
jgi:Chaperone of endosialidase